MNDFDRLLEIELARMLDRVVRTPAPPRRGRPENRPVVKLYSGSGGPTATTATAAILTDLPGVPGPALFP
jgi:hypothetical protein